MTETTTPSVEGDRLEAINATLLACPFCGERPTTRIYQTESLHSHADVDYLQICCNGCDIPNVEWEDFDHAIEQWNTRQIAALPCKAAPIPMVLFCPACGFQHIDEPDTHDAAAEKLLAGQTPWDNPPHRSHLCHGCGHIWRPADVPTTGVQAVQTKGKADSPALPCKGGEAERPTREALERRAIEAVEAYADWADLNADMFDSCDAPNAAADAMMKRAYAALEAVKAVATPTTEPDTGRGLREALEAFTASWNVARAGWDFVSLDHARDQALAALSDTPRGGEISEVETHRADAGAPASKGGAE